MVRKWKLGATGSALLATAFVVVACSSKSDDDTDNNNGAKGGTGTGGSTGGTGAAGKATGGTGGTTATGGTGGTTTTGGTGGAATGGGAGVATGGTSGSGTTGGMGGAAASGPYECKGTVATCNSFESFGTGTAAWWGSGDFNGGFSVFGTGITMDTTTATVPSVHITGMVGGYGVGFNFWFSYCSDLSQFTGVTFTMSGTSAYATTMNSIDFQPQTNSDYPWQARPMDKKGACTSPTPDNPWNDCVAPATHVLLSDMPQTVLWADAGLMNGKPVAFAAATSPKEIIGLQFQFPWDAAATAYAVDVTLDNVSFAGAASKIDCGTMVSGSGGMGSGGAGSGGAASGGMAGSAGAATGGMGGANGGMAGAATGGMGGANGGVGGKAAGGAGGKAAGGKAGSN